MRARVFAGVIAVFALVVGIVGGTPPSPAQALSPGLTFSSDALPTWQTNGQVWALAHSQGRVVVGGSFSQLRPGAGQSGATQNIRSLAILNAATGQPDSCQLQAAFSGGTPVIYAAQAAPDGNTVFVAGNFGSIGGVSVSRLAEIDVVSCSVRPFRVSSISSYVLSLAVTDDAVYFGGYFQNVAGQPRRSFAKVNRAGQLQPWVANASGTTVDKYSPTILPDANSRGTAVVVSPDGSKVAIGGDFFTVNGTSTHSIAVTDATTGSLLRAYPGFVQNTSRTQALRSDDTNFYVGNEGSAAFDGKAAINWNTLNQVWRDTCLGATQALLVHEGVLFSAHHHHDCASMGMFPDGRRVYVTATNAQDSSQRQLGWAPELNDGTGEGLGPRALVVGRVGTNEYLWVGGEFTRVNGQLQQGITRFGNTDTGAPAVPTIAARAITPGEIQVNIRSVVDPDDSDLTYAVYRGNNTTTPVWTGVAKSQWWYRSQATFVDTSVSPGTNYSYRVRAIDRAGNQSALSAAQNATASATGSAYAASVIADNPRLYWRYDDVAGSNWVIDSAGQTVEGLNGIAQGPVTRTAEGALPGDSSRSATFVEGTMAGPRSYIWNDQIAYGPTEYSIETWFRTTSTTGGALVSYGNGRPRSDDGSDVISSSYTVGGTPLSSVTSTYDRTLYMESGTGRLRFAVRAPSTVQSLQSTAAYNDGQWHHVVATQGPAGMRLYVDGMPVAQNSVTQNRPYYGSWRVGGDNLNGFPNSGGNNNWAGRYFDGQIDETAVYYHPITLQQVAAHYTAGGGTSGLNQPPADAYGAAVFNSETDQYWRFDETSGTVAQDASLIGSRTGTVGGSVSRANDSPINGRFVTTPGSNTNGSGIVTQQTQTPAPTQWSAELWFSTTTATGGKLIGFENSQTGNGTNTGTDKHVYMSTDGRLHVGVFSSNQNRVASSSASFNDGQWHHVVATQGTDGLRLYVDGQQVASTTYTTSRTTAGWWRVGGGYLTGWANAPAGAVTNHYFAGSIDDVAVYSTALSAATVSAHFGIGIQDSAPPTVPGGVTGSYDGGAQVSWTASTDNTAVAGYRVYRGTTAGFTPSAGTLRGTVTTTSFSEPLTAPGTHYYKVVAFDAAGNESAASAAAAVEVPDTTAPTVPTNVVATQDGADVDLTWTASTDNVAVTGYAVHRGTTAGFTPTEGNRLAAAVTGTSYTDDDVEVGTWFYKVVAFDAAGNESAASSAASVEVVTPDVTAPTVPEGLSAELDGANVDLDWEASTDAVGVTGYTVYRGTSAGFTANAASRIADVAGTSYTDEGRPAGTWFYKVTARDAAGNVSAATAAVSVTIVAPAEPVVITVTPTDDAMAAQNAATTLYGTTNQLSTRLGGAGSIESFIRVDVPAAPAGTQLTSVQLNVRTSNDATAHSTDTHEVRLISGTWNEATINWNNRPTGSPSAVLGTLSGMTALNTPYVVSLSPSGMSAVLGETVTLRLSGNGADNLRLWSAESTPANYRPSIVFTFTPTSAPGDTTAPSTPGTPSASASGTTVELSWSASTDNVGVTGYSVYRGATAGFTANAASRIADVTGTSYDDEDLAPGTYFYKVTARDAAGNVSTASAAGSATVAAPTDTTAPSTPGTPSATANGTTVNLSWSASTDNVAVTGYSVYRGATAGFTANAASRIADATGTTYADTGLAAGAYFYKVTARDAAGNVSTASAAGSATVTVPAGPPITQTIVTNADTMAAAINAAFAYGATNQLSARSDTAIQSFMRFALPDAPAGYTLTGATLAVRTSDDATANSSNAHQLHLVDADWDEATLTWNNRPTTTASGVLGQLTGATSLNTAYTVTLSTAELAPRAGTAITLRLSSATGTDNVRIWSREIGSAAWRPTLTLTYTPTP